MASYINAVNYVIKYFIFYWLPPMIIDAVLATIVAGG